MSSSPSLDDPVQDVVDRSCILAKAALGQPGQQSVRSAISINRAINSYVTTVLRHRLLMASEYGARPGFRLLLRGTEELVKVTTGIDIAEQFKQRGSRGHAFLAALEVEKSAAELRWALADSVSGEACIDPGVDRKRNGLAQATGTWSGESNLLHEALLSDLIWERERIRFFEDKALEMEKHGTASSAELKEYLVTHHWKCPVWKNIELFRQMPFTTTGAFSTLVNRLFLPSEMSLYVIGTAAIISAHAISRVLNDKHVLKDEHDQVQRTLTYIESRPWQISMHLGQDQQLLSTLFHLLGSAGFTIDHPFYEQQQAVMAEMFTSAPALFLGILSQAEGQDVGLLSRGTHPTSSRSSDGLQTLN